MKVANVVLSSISLAVEIEFEKKWMIAFDNSHYRSQKIICTK
jgi:hypothetical protein